MENYLRIEKLSESTFSHLLSLLKERGEAPEDYYRWKYLDQPTHDMPTGFIAYLDNKPVGCIGIINRLFCDENGNDQSATWFADWYVSDVVRGKGIGEFLMSEVRKTAYFNFGIPGPKKAQIVCKKAGYVELQGFSQFSLYINSFRCGYKRFSGLLFIKVLRGIRSLLYSLPAKISLFSADHINGFVFDLPNEQQSCNLTTRGNQHKVYLKRTNEFFHWIKQIPTAESAKRSWWHIDNVEIYAFGYIDTDFWGLRKAVIMDIHCSSVDECIWRITRTLGNAGADWIVFSYFDPSLTLKHWSKSLLPLHIAAPNRINKLHLTDMDKDSSWRSFLFA